MNFSSSRKIEQLAARNDREGLYALLQHRSATTRLEAAMALAELEDGRGWRYLTDTVSQAGDPESQEIAAEMLGDLGHPRALPALEQALRGAGEDARAAILEAIAAIGGSEADETMRRAGMEPVAPRMSGNQQLIEFDAGYVQGVMPDTELIKIHTAEEHFDTAADLREAEFAERGLVEISLAQWLAPDWAYAWYLRGVLLDDLERPFEAMLAYSKALELDPNQPEAREALQDLETEHVFPPVEMDILQADLEGRSWSTRRDAAAGLGWIAKQAPDEVIERLLELIDDEDREVRHAAIHALGEIGDRRAIEPLAEHAEDSWLLRFALVEALAKLHSAVGVEIFLRREMDRIHERNPIFSRHKDPLLELEYGQLMEIGVLALEKTGDIETLLALSEGNTWVEVEEEAAEEADPDEYNEEEDQAAEEDLDLFVDEVAQMVSVALERLALPRLAQLDSALLQRLTLVPDLTLLDLTGEEEGSPSLVHDLSAVREAAQKELASRK